MTIEPGQYQGLEAALLAVYRVREECAVRTMLAPCPLCTWQQTFDRQCLLFHCLRQVYPNKRT